MSFQTKYYTSFTGQTTSDQFDVFLKKRDYVGDTFLLDLYSTSPLIISNQGGRDAEYNSIVGSSASFSFFAKERYQYIASNNILLNNGFAENLGDWSQRSTGHSWYWNAGNAAVDIGYNTNTVYVPSFPVGWTGSSGWFMDSTPSISISGAGSRILEYNSLTGFTGTGTTNDYTIKIINSSYPLPTIVDFTVYYYTATGGSIALSQANFAVTGSTQFFTGTLNIPLNKQAGRIRLGFQNGFGNVNISIESFLATYYYQTWGGTSKILYQTTGELLAQDYTFNYDFSFASGSSNQFNIVCRDSGNSEIFTTGITAGTGNQTGSLTINGNNVNDIGFFVTGESGITQTFNLNEVSLLTTTSYDLTPQEQFLDLFESSYKDWILQVNKNGSLYWIGYVKPENLTSKFFFPSYIVNLQAVDGLADLKNSLYPASTEKLTELEAIQEILSELNNDFNLPISSQVNLKEVHGVTGATLEHIYINPIRFSDTKNGRTTLTNKYKSVEYILDKYLSTLIQSNGGWEITQLSEFNSLKRTYNNNDLSITDASINNRIIDLSSGTTLFNSDSVSKITPYRYTDVKLNNRYSGENYLANGSVTSGITGWQNTNFDVFEWSPDYGGTLYCEGTSIFMYALSDAFAINATTADTTTISYDVLKTLPPDYLLLNTVYTYAQLIDDSNNVIHTTEVDIINEVWATKTFTANFAFNGNLRLRVFIREAFYAGTEIHAYLDNISITTQYKNNSVFDQYLLVESVDSSAINTYEKELFFADVPTQNEVAALRYNNTTGLTSTWSNYDESNFGKSLNRWHSTELLNKNRRFRNYVRFDLLADQDIFYNNVLKIYERHYKILSLDKDLLQGRFSFELSEVVTGYTQNLSFTDGQYTTSDGQNTGGGISGGGSGSGGISNINAVNGLSKAGNDIRFGGTLDSNTTLTTANGAKLIFDNYPVFYNGNYSTDFNARTLVDAGFVTGITNSFIEDIDYISGVTDTKLNTSTFNSYTGNSQPILNAAITGITAGANLSAIQTGRVVNITFTGSTGGGGTITGSTNGLSVTGSKIKLGGQLTGNTTISNSTGGTILHFDNTNKRLGIGTTSPVVTLHQPTGKFIVGDTGTTLGYVVLKAPDLATGSIFLQGTHQAAESAAYETIRFKANGVMSVKTTVTGSGGNSGYVRNYFESTNRADGATNVEYYSGNYANKLIAVSFNGGGLGVGLIGNQIAARLHAKGVGTGTGSLVLLEDSIGTQRLKFRDDGVIQLGTVSDGTIIINSQAGATRGLLFSAVSNFSDYSYKFAGGSTTHTSGNRNTFQISSGTFAPTSGSGTFKFLDIVGGVNQTSTANGAVYGIDYNPTITSVLGTHYGALIRSGLVGIGNATPTAKVDIKSDTSSSGTAFRISDSAGTERLKISDAGMVDIHNSLLSSRALRIWTGAGTGVYTQYLAGRSHTNSDTYEVTTSVSTSGGHGLKVSNVGTYIGSSTNAELTVGSGVAPTTGSLLYRSINIIPTFNIAGGTQTLVGVDYNPTVTAIPTGATHIGFRQQAGITVNSSIITYTGSSGFDNFNPAGLNGASVVRITGLGANTNFTGIKAGQNGQVLTIINASTSYYLNLQHDNAGSSAANRFYLFASSVVIPKESVKKLIYDGVSQRWRAFE